MKLDIRYPIGLLFLIVGGILAVYGLGSPPPGLNVNLWWGLVQVAFGGVMLGLAASASRSGPGR